MRTMEPSLPDLHADVRDLRAAAARVAQGAGSAAASDIPELLGQLEATLRELSSACYSLGPSIAPPPQPPARSALGRRDGRAYSDSPSNEKKAVALSNLHELGAAVGGAARRCRSARTTLAPTVDSGRDAGEPRRSIAPMVAISS